MENDTKTKIEKYVKIGVYQGLPLIGGFALATALVPLDGGTSLIKASSYTATGIAKFALVSFVGYGALKSAIGPDQLDTVERIAQATAESIRQNMTKKAHVVEAEVV